MKTKTKIPLILMSLFFAPLLTQADQTKPIETVKTGQLPAGYNESATYRCIDGWDVFVSADYIYWNWQQESLELKTLEATSGLGTQETIFQTPGYASGFQVGLGFNMPGMDDWNLYFEYTWYQNSNSASLSNDAEHAIQLAQGGLFFLDRSAGYDFNVYLDYNMRDFAINKILGNMYL